MGVGVGKRESWLVIVKELCNDFFLLGFQKSEMKKPSPVLQLRTGNRDNLEIISLISP